jgi:hypothetical protein
MTSRNHRKGRYWGAWNFRHVRTHEPDVPVSSRTARRQLARRRSIEDRLRQLFLDARMMDEDQDVLRQLSLAARIMDEDQDILRTLAKQMIKHCDRCGCTAKLVLRVAVYGVRRSRHCCAANNPDNITRGTPCNGPIKRHART